MTLGDLFVPVPLRWGLRGDPQMWEAMRLRFADHDFPSSDWILSNAVRAAFEEITGVRLGPNIGALEVPEYRKGRGMSDGFVSGDWWHEVGLALLVDRWNVVSASQRGAR